MAEEVLTTEEPRLLKWKEGVECHGVLTVWPGTIVEEGDEEKVMQFFDKALGIEPVIVGCVRTLPDPEHRDMEKPETGGRSDFFFYVKMEEISRFAVPRFQYGMRWWEDIFFNKGQEDATQIMLHVHQRGVGVCGVFTYEVAETKVNSVMDFARKHHHPLQCTLEKD